MFYSLAPGYFETTVHHIEAGQFLPHSSIRFPQNGCISCPQLGLCLGDPQLIESKLIRPGASDFDWFNDPCYLS
ncbi:MAG: hypothetical protein DMG32_14570 [Acidobacteria bacterium]|nr:MAG: hypothetical protein DMG32_14570 [Acidobacteriota bacterium]